MFDPGGFTGRLRACPFLGRKRALLCGEGIVRALDAAPFVGRRMTRESYIGEGQANRLRRTYSGQSLFLRIQADLKMSRRQGRLKAIEAMG